MGYGHGMDEGTRGQALTASSANLVLARFVVAMFVVAMFVVALCALASGCGRLVSGEATDPGAGGDPQAADGAGADGGSAPRVDGSGALLDSNAFPQVQGAFALGNDTPVTRTVRVRTFRQDVRLDCAVVASAPAAVLSKSLFGPATTWLLASGRALPVSAPPMVGGPCRAVLIDGSDLAPTLVFWSADSWPDVAMPSTLAGALPGRLLRLVAVEGSLEVAAHEAVFDGPALFDPAPTPACAQPTDAAALAWAEPAPTGALTLVGMTAAPDGCLALQVQSGQGPQTWYLCLPAGGFPFVAGDEVYAEVLLGGHDGGPVKGVQWQSADGRLLRFGVGVEAVDFGGGGAEHGRVPGCAGLHDDCGTLSVPLQLQVTGATGAKHSLRAGESLEIGSGVLALVRARELPVFDAGCLAPAPAGHVRIETVFVVSEKVGKP